MAASVPSPPLPVGCQWLSPLPLPASWPERIESALAPWRDSSQQPDLLLLLAATATAEVEGISAAGSSAASRRYTALADAELLLYGPDHRPQWPLPPLPAGVSPALISWVASQRLGLQPLVAALGLAEPPPFVHLRLEPLSEGPAACLSSGQAMTSTRVERLWSRGMQIGRGLQRPLLLAECVPGGTTTAQAVLQGLGLSVAGLVGGSALHPPMVLKQRLVAEGLRRADLGAAPTPGLLLAAVGDPFQAVAAGLLVGALESGQPLLLGGGSQMVAVLALALASLPPRGRAALAAQVVLGTTAWLGSEQLEGLQPGSPPALSRLLTCLQGAMGVELLALTSGLRFVASRHQALEDYEHGHVKEGVGAGALALLAQLRGVSPAELQESCEEGLDRLQRQ